VCYGMDPLLTALFRSLANSPMTLFLFTLTRASYTFFATCKILVIALTTA
jgi:hypothetical protein